MQNVLLRPGARPLWWLLPTLAMVSSCSSEATRDSSDNFGDPTDGVDVGSGGSRTHTPPPGAGGDDTLGPITVTPAPTDMPDASNACEAVVQKAEHIEGGRADVILAVDNSASMSDEVIAIQNNLNQFSNQIAASGIDTHVVVVSAGPLGSPAQPPPPCTADPVWCGIVMPILSGVDAFTNLNGICIEPPLGAPNACPLNEDSNPGGGYLHYRQPVNSSNSLAVLQTTFAGWESMLRADAAKTFVVVTDDDNGFVPTGADFKTWVDSLPVFQSAVWRFSGVFCVTNSINCARVGATYGDLVSQTGGISGDLAQFSTGNVDAQFKAVFDSLAQAIVQDAVPVDCEWAIPPPPSGEHFDKNAVNVNFTDSAGTTQRIFALDSETECDPLVGGWYYDNWENPSQVVACPSTCEIMQADKNARVEVLFGCARERPPIR